MDGPLLIIKPQRSDREDSFGKFWCSTLSRIFSLQW